MAKGRKPTIGRLLIYNSTDTSSCEDSDESSTVSDTSSNADTDGKANTDNKNTVTGDTAIIAKLVDKTSRRALKAT
jgi:hypothetical protein